MQNGHATGSSMRKATGLAGELLRVLLESPLVEAKQHRREEYPSEAPPALGQVVFEDIGLEEPHALLAVEAIDLYRPPGEAHAGLLFLNALRNHFVLLAALAGARRCWCLFVHY